jgi:hypothetical protein
MIGNPAFTSASVDPLTRNKSLAVPFTLTRIDPHNCSIEAK